MDNSGIIFICHSKKDKHKALELHSIIQDYGYNPWLDEVNLLPGQKWEHEIKKIIQKEAACIVICLSSHSVDNKGYIHKEISFAIDAMKEYPNDSIFIIPVRIDNCIVPHPLEKLHWVDLYENEESSIVKILQSISLAVKGKISDELVKFTKLKCFNCSQSFDISVSTIPRNSGKKLNYKVCCPFCEKENIVDLGAYLFKGNDIFR